MIKGIYIILDSSKLGNEVLDGGCRLLQLRNKTATSLWLYEEAKRLREITKRYKAIFIINDRVDIALAVDADGVHLGRDDLPIRIARELLKNKIIGFSADTIEEALQAEKEGADYISLGPIFPTQTKPDAGPVVGLKTLAKLKPILKVPLVAIGGINKYNLIEVVKSGADAVAVISAVCSSPSPRQAVEELVALFQRAKEDKQMKVKIKFQKSNIEIEGELYDTKTAKALFNALPICSTVERWGKEIYFATPVKCEPEDPKETVELGDMGYWPPEQSWCIFFGPTPISKKGEIRPDSPVDVFGKIKGLLKELNKVKEGDIVIVEPFE